MIASCEQHKWLLYRYRLLYAQLACELNNDVLLRRDWGICLNKGPQNRRHCCPVRLMTTRSLLQRLRHRYVSTSWDRVPTLPKSTSFFPVSQLAKQQEALREAQAQARHKQERRRFEEAARLSEELKKVNETIETERATRLRLKEQIAKEELEKKKREEEERAIEEQGECRRWSYFSCVCSSLLV